MSLVPHFTDSLYDAALALLYPQACEVCGASVEARAEDWFARLAGARRASSTQMNALLEMRRAQRWRTSRRRKRMDVRCRRCDEDAFDGARACGVYQGALRASILALKREPHVAARIAQLLCEAQQRAPLSAATRIVPVPLHPERQRERGFNQAAILGGALAKLTGLPLDEWSLVRTRHTERHRAGMDAQARRESVAEAFRVARPRLIENESILLIDDVLTTGATVSACAAALKAAGARAVFVLTLARP